MASVITKTFVTGAALFGGLLAGMGVNRTTAQMSAWERIGVVPWAAFTRIEYTGRWSVLYPGLGLLALLFTVGAAIAYRFDRDAHGARGLPVYAAATLAMAWSVVTRGFVVPVLSHLSQIGPEANVRWMFVTLERWWGINDVLRVATFGLNLWALVEVFSKPRDTPV
jgi:hypothetical protein